MRFLKVFVGLSLLMIAPLRGDVPAAAVKGLYTQMKQGAEDFSPVFGFLALKSGVLERIRFFTLFGKFFKTHTGPSPLQGYDQPIILTSTEPVFTDLPHTLPNLHTHWIHPAFQIKDVKNIKDIKELEEENRRNFTRQFEYPLDAISALIQWLFPSVDGALFVENNRGEDPVGEMGSQIKALEELPRKQKELDDVVEEIKAIQYNDQDYQNYIAKCKECQKNLKDKTKKKKEKSDEKELGNPKIELPAKTEIVMKKESLVKKQGELEGEIHAIKELIENKKDRLANVLKIIYQYSLLGEQKKQDFINEISSLFPKRWLKESVKGEVKAQDKNNININFATLLYDALVQDGTFKNAQNKNAHDHLYPPHIVLHALLGYLWRVADTKEQVVHIMDEAGLLKERPLPRLPQKNDHRLSYAIQEHDFLMGHYEKIKKAIIENPGNASLEDLAYGGYGYELYEKTYPEMIIYSTATQPDSYPDCGETALRNFFNVILFKGAGEFDPSLLNQYELFWKNKKKFGQIKNFYTKFSTIESQKSHDARDAWSVIVSQLNDHENSPSVMYKKQIAEIHAAPGMKNILNVLTKLTGDDELSKDWEGNSTQQISEKLTRLGKFFNRGESFKIKFLEKDDEKEKGPFHGDFIFTVTRQDKSQDFTFYISTAHFELTPQKASPQEDWRKEIAITLIPLLDPFYNKKPTSPFLNPLLTDQDEMDHILGQWREKAQAIPLTLRYLYKMYGAQVSDPFSNAQIDDGLKIVLSNPLDPRIEDFIISLSRLKNSCVLNTLMGVSLNEFTIISLFKKGAKFNVDGKDITGKTPLHWAASNGYLEIVEFLLKNGAQDHIDEKDIPGKTPLDLALSNNHLKIVELLLKNGAKLNQKDDHGHTPLHQSVYRGYIDIVRLLLKNKAQINEQDNYGYTPLHQAAYRGYIDIVRLLLKNKAQIDKKDNYGNTPLYWAVKNWHIEVAKLLFKEGANRDIQNNTEERVLDLLKNKQIKKFLHDHHNQSGILKNRAMIEYNSGN